MAGSQAPEAFKSPKKLSRLQLELHPGAEFKIEGYGMPFANPGHPSHMWINHEARIVGDLTLVDLLQQRSLILFVDGAAAYLIWKLDQRLPQPFSYPYGTAHFWNLNRYLKDIPANVVSLVRPVAVLPIVFFVGFPSFPLPCFPLLLIHLSPFSIHLSLQPSPFL